MAVEWRDMVFSEAVVVNPRVELRRGNEYPFVDMQALIPGARLVHAAEERVFDGGGSKFSAGDTLMAKITPCLENGKIARFFAEPNTNAHGSTEFIVLRGRENVTDTDFVYYLTRSDEVFGFAISQMTGTSGRQRVPTSALDHLIVRVPPIGEQRAIARILGTLDQKIELNQRMNKTLESIARLLFKSWFVDFDPVSSKTAGHDLSIPKSFEELFPDSFQQSQLGAIPKGWSIKSIGELADIRGGSTPSTKDPAFWEGGSYNWVTPKDLAGLSVPVLLGTERRITDAGVAQIGSGLQPRGTVLLSSRAPIGYLAITEIPVAINQGFIAMRPKKDVSNLFLLFWASFAHETILSRANGSTFLEINKANFRQIQLIVPSSDVMEKFDQLARPLYDRIVTNERESRTLEAVRDVSLSKLTSGEIRVHGD